MASILTAIALLFVIPFILWILLYIFFVVIAIKFVFKYIWYVLIFLFVLYLLF
jgi:hypothetical protein